MKFVVRPQHIISVGGYIVETEFPYRNIIVVNPTEEPIKIDIPIFSVDWIEEHRKLGLEITPLKEEETFLTAFKRAKAKLDAQIVDKS
ncbi:MAG: energy-converting hydrogenase B subunit P [Methanobacterium paludis]|jgi:energy-converting hydrogenase B subunit P|uniref:Energy-converting hydrogenase B, subunit P n=1 Tax=Methanobacterium paludis (strain DSM 25820 / JCM 18151 / SWAN1) TaxID=868131 RepID=F6D402_METPW|nr:energy-converting hydrogenase B subunit EhbP [Methanobacterium paludis]AEG19179.1 Energy-converting hydrogenase B, subunit P [Methanobacterium paludis]MCE7697522.1 energy-converting hydrogenase B subunit P [Methanobacterium paludis]